MSTEDKPGRHSKNDSTSTEDRRNFLKVMAGGMAAGVGGWVMGPLRADALAAMPDAGSAAAYATEMDEYNRLFKEKIRRCVEVGFHYHDLGQFGGHYDEILSGFDAKAIVANLVRANADSCHIWAEAISDYYFDAKGRQLQLAHKHKSLRGRDLIRELSEEAKKHGISVLAYFSANSSVDFAKLHPESVMKDENRQPIGSEICYNSPLFFELQKERSSYLFANYHVAGLFFDMMNYPFDKLACYCDACNKLFQEKYGIEQPTKPEKSEAWAKFLDFRYQSNARFARELKAYLRERFPGKLICFNYHGHMPFAWQTAFRPVGHASLSDATMAEDFAGRFSQNYPSLTAAFLSAVRPGAVCQVMTDMTLGGYGDFTQRPVADLKWDLFTAKMRSANVMVIEKILHDYSTRPAVYDIIGEAFEEVKEKEPYFDYPAVKEVALYYSHRTRDWYDQYNSDAYERCAIGAYRALTDMHRQVEFVFDESADLARLQQFPVVFLANTAVLTDSEVDVLRKYVASGGNLLVTWETGLYDPLGVPRKDFAIADLLGVHFNGYVDQQWKTQFGQPDVHVEPWNFVRFNKGQWTSGLHADLDLPIVGRPVLIEANGAELFGELRTAFPGGRPPGMAGCSPWKTVGKALATHTFGKGKVAYFPVPLDGQYSTPRGLPDHRNLLRNALDYLHPKRETDIDAPVNVESMVMRRGKREYIVHLVAMWPRKNVKTYWRAPAPTTEVMEEPARYRATIRSATPVRHARALSRDTSIRLEGHFVKVETGQVHEAIIISA